MKVHALNIYIKLLYRYCWLHCTQPGRLPLRAYNQYIRYANIVYTIHICMRYNQLVVAAMLSFVVQV